MNKQPIRIKARLTYRFNPSPEMKSSFAANPSIKRDSSNSLLIILVDSSSEEEFDWLLMIDLDIIKD